MEYLKQAKPQPAAVTQGVRDTVSEILLAVEKEGVAADAIAEAELMKGHALTARLLLPR